MPTDPDETSPRDALARHQAFVAALERTAPMDWDAWALPIHNIDHLTPAGRRAAQWAVDVLRRSFGDPFLVQAWELVQSRPPAEIWEDFTHHPVFGQGFWLAANSAPWVVANLLQLASQLELCRSVNREARTRRGMRDPRDPVKWIHGLLQFEVAGLGLRAGYQVSFEPPLGTGRHADVHLEGTSDSLLVEVASLRMSDREVKTLASAREVSGRLLWGIHDIEARHQVQASGAVDRVTLQAEVEEWLRAVEGVAGEVAHDGSPRDVTGPTEGAVRIERDGVDPAGLSVQGPEGSINPLGRLRAKLSEKAEQASGSTQRVWVRVEESAGLWAALSDQGLSLADKLAYVTPHVQLALDSHPELAGIILAPAVLWAGKVDPELLQVTLSTDRGAVAVQSGLPGYRARECIIVARRDTPETDVESFVRLYADEVGWLDWALGHLGHPPFNELIQE